MKRLLVFLTTLIFTMQLFSQNTVIVGDMTSTQSTQYYPACHFYEDSYTQMLYKSDELQSGTITSISFYCTQGNWSNGTVKIYMKEVSDNTLTTYSSAEGFVEVYTGLDQNAVGWVNFTLTNPFNYSGEDNLLICFIRDGSSWYGGALSYKISTEPNSVLSTFNDAQSYTINSVLNPQWSYRDERPVIKIEYGELGEFCYPPMNVQILAQTISEDQALVSWTPNDETSTTFALAYKAQTEEQWTLVSDTITTNSYTLTELNSYTRYQVKVWAVCPGVNSSEVVKDFMTLPTEDNFISIPYEQNFDNLSMVSHWYFDNPNVNKWYIGSVVNNTLEDDGELTEGNGLYISNTNGTTNSYSTLTTSEANAYTLINVEEASYYGVAFDYKSVGENPYDYLMVLLSPLDETQTNIELYQCFSTNNQWERIEIPFPNDLQAGDYKLIFSWRNDNAGGTNPPAAIDNVNIYSTSCASVNEFAITMEDDSESILMNITAIDSLNEDAEYLVEYRYVGDSSWNTIQSTNPVEIVGLSYASNVEFQVTAICGEGNISFVSDLQTVYTLCSPISEMPYLENFSSFTAISDNLRGNQEAPNCWFNVGSVGNCHWSWAPSSGINSSAALSFLGTSYTTNSTFSEWMISPVFELTGNERLNFQYKITSTSVNMPKIDVYVLDSSRNYSSMADTSNFVFLASFNTANSVVDQWKMAEVFLNSYIGNVRIALVVREASQSFYVDNFTISSQPACPDIYDFAVREASQAVLVTYNTANITESGVLLAYSPITENTTFNPETATTITIAANEELPFLVGGLTTETTYAFAVKQNCGGNWTNPITKTIPFAYTLPITMDFNTTATTPTMTFSAEVNTWVIGSAENYSLDTLSGNALYVSKDNGASATYDKNTTAESFASFPISFTPEAEFELSFDWKCLGEGEYDNISVYLIPYGDTINEAYNIISYNGNSYLSGSADWKKYTKILSNEYFGVYNLVFKWKNDHMLGNQPAGVIDNIKVISHACVSDIDFTLTFTESENNSTPSVIVNITDEDNTGLTYTIKYKSANSTEYTEIGNLTSNNFPYTITEGIEHQMIYDFQIGVVCSQSETLYTPLQTITTPCQRLESPWFENFESNPLLAPSCWNSYSGALTQNGTIATSQLSSTSEGWNIINDSIDSQRSNFLALNTSYNTIHYWAMSPIIDLSNDTNIKQIAFDLGVKGENIFQQTTSDNKFAVLVSLDGGLTWNIANGLVFSDNDSDTNHNFSNLNNQITRYAYKLVDANNQAISGEVRFAFYGETTVYDGNYTIFVDNVSLEQWSECQVPYAISFSAITSNAAKASFNTWGLANSWEYVIAPGVEETVIDTLTPILVCSSSPIELSGLMPTTDYVIGIRSVCGNSYSPWTIGRFTTKEAGASIPYSTSFEDLEDANTWHITNNETNNVWNIGSATSVSTGLAAYISIDNGLTYSAQSGSNITYSYMWKDFSFGETDELFELSFDWKIRGRKVDDEVKNGLAVYLTTYDTPPTDSFPLEEERLTLLYASDSWQNEKVFLDNIRGDKRLVFLTWGYTNSEDTIVPAAIDNVSLYTTTCTPPTSVPEVAEIIGNNAIIMWEDADTTHNQWNVYYKPLGANTYNSTSVTAASVELNNLFPTTTYVLYVTSDCGETESAYSEKITFRTECPLIQLPYEEFFDENVAINTCWTNAKGLLSENVTFVDNQQYWFQSTDSVGDNSTPKMKINIYGTDVRQHWLITPQIDLGNGAETNILSLDVALKAYSSSEDGPQSAPDDVFAIVVSIDGGLTWSSEYALIYTDADEDVEHNFSDFTDTSFTRITYLLQDSYGNPLSGLVKIGFYGESTVYNGDNNLYIDNLYVGPVIEQIIPCDAPEELTATNITSTTAEISWLGSADSYELKLNAGELETISSTSKVLTDLTPSTQYMVEVRAICENEQSAWVAISFLTLSEQDDNIVEGEVNTLSATEIANTSATLNGELVSAGNAENFTVGFALATVSNFTLEDQGVQNITATLENNTFSQSVTGLEEGETYFYRAYITNQVATSYGEVESFTLLGLNNARANQLQVSLYPNPTSEHAILRVEGLETEAKIIISDLQARILSKGVMKANASEYLIDVSKMASGVYYIRIVTDSAISTQKLIVE
jgi:hypothetical protein